MIEQNSMQGGHYAKGLIYCRPIYQLPKLAFLSARAIPSENIFYNDGDNDSNGDNDNDDDSDNGNGNDSDIKQFSLSEQPLITAFGKLSYGKRDFAKAEGRKTENGEGDTRRRRGGGRVKKYNPTKKGVISWQKILKSRDRWLKWAKGLPSRLPHMIVCNGLGG